MMALCECGCGATTALAPHNDASKGWIKGQPLRFLRWHHCALKATPWKPHRRTDHKYAARILHGQRELLHRLRAKKALGHPLPLRAVVHHADGSKRWDAPLVICQDENYHRLLHARMRIVKAGGNPNTQKICSYCRQVRSRELFYHATASRDGLTQACRPCMNDRAKEYQRQHRAGA